MLARNRWVPACPEHPHCGGGLLFSELQRGRGAERDHEVSKKGVRLGLSDT